jgi:hypothetical protein
LHEKGKNKGHSYDMNMMIILKREQDQYISKGHITSHSYFKKLEACNGEGSTQPTIVEVIEKQIVDASLLKYYDAHFDIIGISYKDIIRRRIIQSH